MQVDYWKIQQEMSKEGKSIDNLSQCIDYFVDNNISSDLRTIMDFCERFGLKTSVIKPLPETVKNCFSSFIKMVKPERILNSFVQNGTLAECIASMGYSVTCRSKSDLDKKIVRLLKLKEYRKDSDDKYDLIIADLTFNIPEWFFDEITEFVPKLHDDGSMVFILPSSIVYSDKLLKKVRALEEVGLFAKAYIDLPNNSYAPYTSVSGKLVVFDKYETEDVFFAKIFVDTDIETIIKCYFNHKDAKKDNQGRWFTKGLYEDYREFEKEQRAKKLEKAFNGKLMRLPELYKGAYRPKNNRFT